ncbi:MAG: ROK family protein [Candidatus Geothermincolia bacterium]
MRTKTVIGIDVGGTKTSGVLLSPDMKVLRRSRIETDSASAACVLGGIETLFAELAGTDISPAALGVGFAGFVDFARGVISFAPNLGIHDLFLRDELERRLALPVFVDNDANVAALAESRLGAGRGLNDMVQLTLGTGIGGGIIIDGRVYRGATGTAGEIGHMVLEARGALCGCGARGCFEALASGTAIERMAREAIRARPDSLLARMAAEAGELEGEIVDSAARQGDPDALDIYETVGFYMGLGIGNLVNLLNPERIVLSGGVSRSLDLFAQKMLATIQEGTVELSRTSMQVVLAQLEGEEVGAQGAALLALESLAR